MSSKTWLEDAPAHVKAARFLYYLEVKHSLAAFQDEDYNDLTELIMDCWEKPERTWHDEVVKLHLRIKKLERDLALLPCPKCNGKKVLRWDEGKIGKVELECPCGDGTLLGCINANAIELQI